tara:strand:+ start:1600 stop:1785 length:186 start_codon:yes stop_codon:yes gene_type:complete
MRYGPGEFFFYKDLVDSENFHRTEAIAITPVSLMSLNRSEFCELIHKHPTLVLKLLDRQYI